MQVVNLYSFVFISCSRCSACVYICINVQVQDFRNRQSGGQESLANIRKDRAEIEALQATIEKNKLDYEVTVQW